jgi:hypothetical protein
LFSRRLGDAPVLDAGRTGCFAGAAEKAKVQVIFETFGEVDAPFGGGFYEVNSAARRFRFQAQGAIRGALVQTEPAVNALVEFGKIKRGDLWSITPVLVMFDVIQRWSSPSFESLSLAFSTRNLKPEIVSFKSTTPPELPLADSESRRNSRAWETVLPD